MKHLRNIIGITAGIVLAALAVWLLLHWGPLDKFLTRKLGETRTGSGAPETLIYIQDWDDPLPESGSPYVRQEGNRLLCETPLGAVDITPPDVSGVFYSEESGAAKALRMRSGACVSASGELMLYALKVQDVPKLFLADLRQGGAVEVCGNADSFLFIGEEPVYATGYSNSSTLYVYRGGESVKLAEDGLYYPVPELGMMLDLDRNGRLICRYVGGGASWVLGEGIDKFHSYSVSYDGKLTVWGVSGDNYLRCVLDPESGRVLRFVEDGEPGFSYSDASGDYFWSGRDGKLVRLASVLDPADARQIFPEAGFIYRIYSASEGRILFATADGIYDGTLDASGGSAKKVLSFTGDYREYSRYPWLLAEHSSAGRYGEGYYLISLSDRSTVLNRRNPYSWLNRFSSFVYRLSYIGPDGKGGMKAAYCDCPVTRVPSLPRSIDGSAALFESRFADGQIKALTVLDGGETLLRDALRSEGNSKGTLEITAQIAEGNVLIACTGGRAGASGGTGLSLLRSDLKGTTDAGDVVAVSFGKFCRSNGEK